MWPGYFNSVFPFRSFFWPWILIVLAAEIILKGMALYRSARNGQKYWFVALLIINTIGILPLIYLIWFDKRQAQVKSQASASRSKRRK